MLDFIGMGDYGYPVQPPIGRGVGDGLAVPASRLGLEIEIVNDGGSGDE